MNREMNVLVYTKSYLNEEYVVLNLERIMCNGILEEKRRSTFTTTNDASLLTTSRSADVTHRTHIEGIVGTYTIRIYNNYIHFRNQNISIIHCVHLRYDMQGFFLPQLIPTNLTYF